MSFYVKNTVIKSIPDIANFSSTIKKKSFVNYLTIPSMILQNIATKLVDLVFLTYQTVVLKMRLLIILA